MAEKKSEPDHTQDFLRAMLRRAGGQRLDIHTGEIEAANEEGIGEVEVVRSSQNPDADPDEAGNVPEVLILQQKGK